MAKLAHTSLGGDGFDVWSAITTAGSSPRDEVPLNVDTSRLAGLCHKLLYNNSIEELDTTFHGLHQNYSAIIQGDWKLINGWAGFYDGYWSNGPYEKEDVDASSQGPVSMGGDSVWLFNLKEDPQERKNVAIAHPDIVERLQIRLTELADKHNGYQDPQNNVPAVRSLPSLHNGTWSPWKRSTTEMLSV
jgi:hypothetical protein